MVSELDGIKGIGPKTAEALLQHFKSVKRLREAAEADIAAIIGPAKAKLVVNSLSTPGPQSGSPNNI